MFTSYSASSTNLGAHPLRFLSKPKATHPTRFLYLSLFTGHSQGIALSSVRRSQWRPRCHFNSYCGNQGKDGNFGEEEEEGQGECEREVHCEVHVISWRERRIKAEISVNADTESVWNALTDYEHLADFIPNLVWR